MQIRLPTKLLAVFLIVPTLVACTSGSIELLKTEASVRDTFKAEANYQAITRQLSRRIQDCMGTGSASIFSSPVELKTQIYSELREAELTYFHPASNSHFFHIEVKALDSTSSQVNTWIYHNSQRALVPKIKAWATDANSSC